MIFTTNDNMVGIVKEGRAIREQCEKVIARGIVTELLVERPCWRQSLESCGRSFLVRFLFSKRGAGSIFEWLCVLFRELSCPFLFLKGGLALFLNGCACSFETRDSIFEWLCLLACFFLRTSCDGSINPHGGLPFGWVAAKRAFFWRQA